MLVVKHLHTPMAFSDFFGFSNSEEQKSVSGQQTHKLVFLSFEAILGTKNQKKIYKGVSTEVTSPKTRTNQNETEGKNGLPPISAFL